MLQIFPSTSRTHSLPSTTVTECTVSVTTFSKSDGSDWRAKPFSHMSASGYASLSTDVVVNVKKTGWVGLTVLVGRVTNEVFGLVPTTLHFVTGSYHIDMPPWACRQMLSTWTQTIDSDASGCSSPAAKRPLRRAPRFKVTLESRASFVLSTD